MSQAIIDANIVLGHLVRGEDNLEQALHRYESLVLPTMVIFEVVYVLIDEYGLERRQILEAITSLLHESKINSERIILLNTLFKFKDHPSLSFVDCYLLELSEQINCILLTSDKKLLKKVK